MTLGILHDWFILDHVISRDWIYMVMALKLKRNSSGRLITDPACLYYVYTLIHHVE